MRRLVAVTMVAFALALLLLPGVGRAENSSPESATLLTGENAGDSGRLVGNTGGAGAFYRVDYLVSGRPVTIKVSAVPSRNVTGPAFGFKVYGPGGLVGEAAVEHDELSYTRYALSLAAVASGSYQIQVYNFTDGVAVDFSIEVTGLAASVRPTSAELQLTPVGGTADRPVVVSVPAGTLAGSLAGNANGSFSYSRIEYPGMNTLLQLQMEYGPPSPYQNGAVGFNVYSGDGTRLCTGAEGSRDATTVKTACSAQTEIPDTLTVQVFNYEQGLAINYALSVSGGAGTVTNVSDNTTPAQAFVLDAGHASARGIMPAGPEGTYNYYLLNYPGGSAVNVGIVVDQTAGYVDGTIGFNLYQGADYWGTFATRLNDQGTKRIVSVPINQSSATTLGIQVFNWTRGLPVSYAIYVTGLPAS